MNLMIQQLVCVNVAVVVFFCLLLFSFQLNHLNLASTNSEKKHGKKNAKMIVNALQHSDC